MRTEWRHPKWYSSSWGFMSSSEDSKLESVSGPLGCKVGFLQPSTLFLFLFCLAWSSSIVLLSSRTIIIDKYGVAYMELSVDFPFESLKEVSRWKLSKIVDLIFSGFVRFLFGVIYVRVLTFSSHSSDWTVRSFIDSPIYYPDTWRPFRQNPCPLFLHYFLRTKEKKRRY